MAVENRREGKWTQWERQGGDHSAGPPQTGDGGERWQSKWCQRWDLTVWSLYLCVIGGQAKGWRGREWQGNEGRVYRKTEGGSRGRTGRRSRMALFAEHRHSLCIFSSFKSTYTICSCRLVDILVYVHSSERTHAKSIIGNGEKGAGRCRKL